MTMLLFLMLLSVAYTTAVSARERLRLAVSHRRVASMLGVFTFAAVVVLPLHLLVGFVPLVYLAAWPTFRRAGQKRGKWAYSAGAATIACLVSSEVLHTVPSMLSLPAGIAVFMAVNLAIVAVAIVVEHNVASLAMLANRGIYRDVLIGQALGAAVGEAILWQLPAGFLGLPLLLALHTRRVRTTVVETAGFADGIWTRELWLVLVEEARRTGEWFSMLVVDFDQPSHAVAVATVLSRAAEKGDSVGRLSPGQFGVLLAETPGAVASMEADDITADLGEAGIPAAVGSADSRTGTVQDMLALAAGDAVIRQASAAVAAESNPRP